MKSPEFFIEKTTDFITEIDSYLASPESDEIQDWTFGSHSDYREKDAIARLLTRVRMFVAEYPKSEPISQILEKIVGVDGKLFNGRYVSDRYEQLRLTQNVLRDFIDHLNMFTEEVLRSEVSDTKP